MLDRYKYFISVQKYTVASNTIDICRKWNREGAFSADDLYGIIYTEDEDCVFQYAENEYDENEEIQTMWELLLCILLAIVRIAYQREEQLYVPQDIEIIKADEVDGFLNMFVDGIQAPHKLREYFYKQVCY